MVEPRIRFRHLQTFLEVSRQRSIGKAAEVLHVSQPAVTKTIRELEEALSVKLFEKEGRGIRITRYGEVFLRHAGASVAAIQQGIDSVARVHAGSGPPIRVGALPTVSARVMPDAVKLFLAEKTGSPIKVVTGENAVLLDQLRIGVLDLVVGRLLAGERLEFARLREYPILMPPQNSIIRHYVDRFLLTHGMSELPGTIETVSDAFGRAFVAQSDAVWIISKGVIARDLEDGTLALLPIDTTETRGSVGLTTRQDAEPNSAAEIFARTVREAVVALRL
jgi:LysR family transcriptional regulator, pca operon transcriptional activator